MSHATFTRAARTAGRRALAAICVALTLLSAPPPAGASAGRTRVIVALDVPAADKRAVAGAQADLARGLAARGARELRRAAALPLMVVELDRRSIAALAADPRVAAVEEDRLSAPAAGDSASAIGAPAVWGGGHTGAGQTVVVLDTGVELSHPFLQQAVTGGACFSSTATGTPASQSMCPDGSEQQIGLAAGAACPLSVYGCDHGTHVAGIVAGHSADAPVSGVAPGASVVSVQVYSLFRGDACGGWSSPCALSWSSDQLMALDWVYATLRLQTSVAAVNISLGSGALDAPCDIVYPAMKVAIDQLREAGIATVAAAGNGGSSTGLAAPACISSAVAVGSVDAADSVSWFSNSAAPLALLAPGESITSSVPGGAYGVKQGTSMAAPHVAGAMALLREAAPGASLEEIVRALEDSGRAVEDGRNGLVRPRVQLDAAAELLAHPVSGLAISAEAVSFGAQNLGSTSAPREITVANARSEPLPIEEIAVSGDFARVGGTCPTEPGELPPAASCTVDVAFAPTSAGVRDGTLTVSGGLAGPVEVRLSGVGQTFLPPQVFLPDIGG